ncbi:MAG: TVP38/TMEM64 family protein [Anaerolineae bacterium]
MGTVRFPDLPPAGRMARQWILSIGICITLLAGGWLIWRAGQTSLFADAARLRAWLARLGAWAPAGIILLNAVQALISPLPGQPLNLLSGYLYGPLRGTLLSMAGILLGNAVGLWLIRKLGRPFAVWLMGPVWLERADVFLCRRGSLVLLLAFLIPFLPDDTICILAGLSPLPIPWILLLAAVGRTPGVFLANMLGYSGRGLRGWEWAVLAVCAGAVLIIFWRWRGRLEEHMWRWSQRLGSGSPPAEEQT